MYLYMKHGAPKMIHVMLCFYFNSLLFHTNPRIEIDGTNYASDSPSDSPSDQLNQQTQPLHRLPSDEATQAVVVASQVNLFG